MDETEELQLLTSFEGDCYRDLFQTDSPSC